MERIINNKSSIEQVKCQIAARRGRQRSLQHLLPFKETFDAHGGIPAVEWHTQVVVDSSLLLSENDMQWWKDSKFGLFIHFGLYSVLGQGEWAMFYKRMDTSEYGKLKDSFTVSKFSGKNWVAIAKQAGCRYMVVTSRHHDGFSLFNTSFGNRQ